MGGREVSVEKEEVMYIPLLETLQSLLNNMSVRREVSFVHVLYGFSVYTYAHIQADDVNYMFMHAPE